MERERERRECKRFKERVENGICGLERERGERGGLGESESERGESRKRGKEGIFSFGYRCGGNNGGFLILSTGFSLSFLSFFTLMFKCYVYLPQKSVYFNYFILKGLGHICPKDIY